MFSKRCILTVLLIQILSVVIPIKGSNSSSDDDLMDFAFENNVKSETIKNTTPATQDHFDDAFGDFLDIVDSDADDGLESAIQQKERRVKDKLMGAWDNPSMQRKFAEVLPILKVMTSQQKIAFAALVSAQVGAKQGRELNIDQVR